MTYFKDISSNFIHKKEKKICFNKCKKKKKL